MIWLLLPLAVFAGDYGLKYWIEKKPDSFHREILGGRIKLCKSYNKGAMMNVMEKRPQFLAGFSLGLTLSIAAAYLRLLGSRGKYLLKTALAFLVGGACSNVCDRLTRHHVVDYFSFNVKWKKFRGIVFNLGDIFIFLGTALYIFWNSRRKS